MKDLAVPRLPETLETKLEIEELLTHSVFGLKRWASTDDGASSESDIEATSTPCSASSEEIGGSLCSGVHFGVTSRASGGKPTGATSGRAASFGNNDATSNRLPSSFPDSNKEGNKRLSSGGEDEDEDEEYDQAKRTKLAGHGTKKLACPYSLHDPHTYQAQPNNKTKYKTCASGLFDNISSLK